MALSCFPEGFRNFYVVALTFQGYDVIEREKTALTRQSYCHLDVLQ